MNKENTETFSFHDSNRYAAIDSIIDNGQISWYVII